MYTPEIGYNLSVKHWSFLIFITILLFLLPVLLVSQDLDWDALRGSEEFRFGVQAYNSGLFDNALLSFERALSYSPLEALYKEWLGRTYHRLGYDATALSLWREVLSSGEGSALLQQRVDVISARNSLERGSRLVSDSGDTLEEIVGGVKKVSDIVAEIAAASAEQSSGIEQVNKAIMQMDEVTQQNAAMVEQMAAASRSLEEQAATLNRVVSFFQLEK